MKLITYKSVSFNGCVEIMGYTFSETIESFILKTQKYDEVYFILNSEDVSQEFYLKYKGTLKGE